MMIAGTAAAATYSVSDLGELTNLPERSDSRPNAINENGALAGANVLDGQYRAMLHDGSWNNLGTLGGDESIAADVNDAGLVVGFSMTADEITRAFLWSPDGTDGVPGNPRMRELETPGGMHSEAYSINASGVISGYAQTDDGDHAFVLADGDLNDIGALLQGLPNSYGLSINEAGHVVGIAYNAAFTTPRAFFYNGSTTVDIGHLGGGNASALAINDDDHIAGYSTTPGGFDHAFHYQDGGMTDLGTLGGNYSYAIAINNNNVVVGGSFVDGNNDVYHAFVSNGGSMVDLNSLLDASGDGWTLIEARAINDAGQIAGIGRFNGANHAFLLNPLPTPPLGPMITGIRIEGDDVLITLTTDEDTGYTVEATDSLSPDSWNDVITGIAGNGDIVTITDVDGADRPGRFYRVRFTPP
jgi:probable HAF family extracellular repeat protein